MSTTMTMATPSTQKLKKSPTNNKSKSSTSSNSNSDTDLPPKPYTEYTIFFRLERAYILQRSGIIDEETLAVIDPSHHDPLEFPRPPKYTTLVLPPYWYSSSHKAAIEKKRKHRKREGRMDLKTLSKTISANWRNCDSAVIEYCRGLSRAESEKYNLAVEAVLARQEEEQANLNANSGGNGILSGNGTMNMGAAAAQLQGGSSSGGANLIPDGALSLQALQDRMSNGNSNTNNNNNHSFSRQSSTHSAMDMSNHSMNNVINNMNLNQMNANFLKVKGYGGALPEQGMNNNQQQQQQQQQDLMRLFQLQQLQNAHNQQLQNQNAQNQGGGQFNISPNSVTSGGCTPFSSSNNSSNNNMSTMNHVASNNNISSMNNTMALACTPFSSSNNNNNNNMSTMNHVASNNNISAMNNTMAQQQVSSSRNREGLHSAAGALTNNSSSSSSTRDGLTNGPIPKNKRKFLRRASAPAEYTGHDIFTGMTTSQIASANNNNDNVTMMNNMRSSITSGMMGISEFPGSDSCNHQAPLKKSMRRRATVECTPTPQDMASLKKGAWNKLNRRLSGSDHGLSASFTAELGGGSGVLGSELRGSELRGSFTCVPDWKQEDANTLLGILNQDDPLNVEQQSQQQGDNASTNAGSSIRGYGNGVDAMLAAFEQEEGDFPSLDMAMGGGDGEGLTQQWGQQQQQQQQPPMNNGLCNFIR